ncbi:glutathione S-transferase family protein [Shewanella sp. 10N.286.48.B5]|uniref:glutathione S-transferase family protein n=1 Tax=Shewanella sp. 10N.286.48.B5 TaxID=1880834 RepID=UPI000C81ED0D|nr:glutathione S-transferase [Shewanella sp. 10N.286.48.B5]PMH86306.1 glutathione S-transferase [Shewanella sp. 10N.286.48.B5]
MITVHHLVKSRSKRVLWLLEEMKLPYELVIHQRDPNTNLAPKALYAIHPLGKSPIMVDDDITICESGAIMEYILNQDYSTHLRPDTNSSQYYQYLEWLHFAEGSLALPVITTLLLQMEPRAGSCPLDGYIAKELAIDFAYIDQYLASHSYFAGNDFSAADIMMTIMLEIAMSLKLLKGQDNIKAYLCKVQQRAAYQLVLKHG